MNLHNHRPCTGPICQCPPLCFPCSPRLYQGIRGCHSHDTASRSRSCLPNNLLPWITPPGRSFTRKRRNPSSSAVVGRSGGIRQVSLSIDSFSALTLEQRSQRTWSNPTTTPWFSTLATLATVSKNGEGVPLRSANPHPHFALVVSRHTVPMWI